MAGVGMIGSPAGWRTLSNASWMALFLMIGPCAALPAALLRRHPDRRAAGGCTSSPQGVLTEADISM
jgi:hypothetical protein